MNSTKSWKKPTPDQVNKALALLVHPQQRQYFFNRLENPEWIGELKQRNWFKTPPPVIQIDNNTVNFPTWFESRYLARMAIHRPEEVLEIALSIKTDNPRVHQDFVEAALNMPPALAASMEVKIRGWIEKSPYSSYLGLGEKVGELISFLANGHQVQAALKLARVLLAVLPTSQNRKDSSTENRSVYQGLTRFDQWHYNRVLMKRIPDLVAVANEETLSLLCGLLQDAVAASQNLPEQPDAPIWEDYSYIWRPQIEDRLRDPQIEDLRNSLTNAVRDVVQQILEADSTKLCKIVALLRKWHWRIYHRLAINLIRQFPTVEPSLVAEVLTTRDYFDYFASHQDYEYTLLVHEQFAHLSNIDQQIILDWIAHPNIIQFEGDNSEDHLRRIKRWQLRKLASFKDSLVGQWRQTYEELTNELGGVELSDLLPSRIQVRSASTNPEDSAALAGMEIGHLVEFLKTWKLNDEGSSTIEDIFNESSQERLASSLQDTIESDPIRYAAVAERFRGLSATYLYSVLRGLRKSLSQEQPIENIDAFPWASVLALCLDIVQVSSETRTPETASRLLYSEWREARRAVADILGLGLSTQNRLAIPLELREQVWAVLHPLTVDPDPTPDYEAKYYDSPNQRVSDISINTVRGEALHTVIRYALWLRRYQENSDSRAVLLGKGFDEMPEVRQVLEVHLVPANDPSLAIRSIYGQWFPWLALLDERWAHQHIHTIFPHNTSEISLRYAAWNSYIVFCSPYDNCLNLLLEEYRFAIDQLGSTSDVSSSYRDPNEGLVQHLMVFYWREQLNLEENGLLKSFYLRASVTLRKQAIEFIGRSLYHTQGEIDQHIQMRLIELWNFRLVTIQNSSQSDEYQAELTAYGWWLASGKFNADWAIAQLRVVLETVGEIEADHFVVERLAKLSGTHLQSVLECLQLLIEQDTSDWRIHGWNDEARQILTLALQQGNPEPQRIARNTINLLGRKGYWEFRNLLTSDNSSEVT